ncbi:MAG: tRNA (N6-isopentenyl adenosine(37)-C2)-methylthiotransferase MiaB [Myxococcota bacterium]
MNAPSERPKVFMTTYGCQMNVLDTELVRGQLEALGYGFTDTVGDAGVVLINTCSVRELSEQKVWSQLGRLAIQKKKENPDLVVGVLGCMAEREAQGIFQRMPHVDLVCGPSMLDKVPSLVDNAVNNSAERQVALTGHVARRSAVLDAAKDGIESLDLSRAFSPIESKFQAYARITRGCNKFCSFCVVPYTRGPEVHRPPQHVIDEVKRLVDAGALEVTLLGQTINHYTFKEGDRTTTFADLLVKIHDAVPELPRLRFVTSYPRDFTDEALDAMASCERICRYLHVPAQSGSNAMLKVMNRGYTVEEYYAFLDRARERMPDIRLSGDMIIGFPGESDEDHALSIGLLERARYERCFIFKYSPRPGTVAIRRFEDTVPTAVKKQRNAELLDAQARISHELHRERIGSTLRVLVESETRLRNESPVIDGVKIGWENKVPSDWVRLVGRTTGDEITAFDGPKSLIGSLTDVRIVDATPLTLMGAWADKNARN